MLLCQRKKYEVDYCCDLCFLAQVVLIFDTRSTAKNGPKFRVRSISSVVQTCYILPLCWGFSCPRHPPSLTVTFDNHGWPTLSMISRPQHFPDSTEYAALHLRNLYTGNRLQFLHSALTIYVAYCAIRS